MRSAISILLVLLLDMVLQFGAEGQPVARNGDETSGIQRWGIQLATDLRRMSLAWATVALFAERLAGSRGNVLHDAAPT